MAWRNQPSSLDPLAVFAGIAEFERALIRERTGAGREAAKKKGVQFGRPRAEAQPRAGAVSPTSAGRGESVRDLAKTFDVHIATIYRLVEARA